MAPQVEQGKPGWMKLSSAGYYCLASITVQFMNKARKGSILMKKGMLYGCTSHDLGPGNSALPAQWDAGGLAQLQGRLMPALLQPDRCMACLQALFTLYGFNYPLTVALMQMAFIAPVCYCVARPKLEWVIARGIMPLALVNVLNVVSGLIGVQLRDTSLAHDAPMRACHGTFLCS